MKHYDFIIAGGGVAGLSLAYHLSRSPLRDRSMLIIDREPKDRNDVTLSFWATEPTIFDIIVDRTWDRLHVISENFEKTLELRNYRYKTIRGIDYYRFVRQELSDLPNVEFMLGKVERIDDGADRASVAVDGQTYTGGWVFDSVFDITEFQPDTSRCRYLQQHFKGWEIETDEPVFNTGAATFFDFRTPQDGELRFFYALPYTERYALVEYVVLSREKYERDLKEHIETVMGIKNYRIVAEEGGISPLTDHLFPRKIGQRVMTLGIRGGRIKPSSGYAFTRILKDSAAIVESLLRHGHPFDVPRAPRFFTFCDAGTLRVMQARSEWMKPLFLTLFKYNPIERILRYQDEVTSPWENVLIAATLLPRLLALAARELMSARGLQSALEQNES